MKAFFAITFSCFAFLSHAQLGVPFRETEKYGVTVEQLDSIYKSAVHTDTTKAVFKTEKDQQQLQRAYIQLIGDFGEFLSKHNFKWDEPTRCFNRIYFRPDGKIDYFLFNFTGKAEDKPSPEKQEEFKKLLNEFIAGYIFPLKAKVKFAQCSPVTYQP